jgi:quinol monooxygenase YgiN
MTPAASTTGTLKVGLFVRLEAKPGKEDDVLAFLRQGLQMANQEATTTFAIFDSFTDESGRKAHLKGPIADALMAQAPTLLSAPPTIESVDVIGAKLPG